MKELNTAELYPKICRWLGRKIEGESTAGYPLIFEEFRYIEVNFLHDRNQQKWIKDRIIELDYVIAFVSDNEGTNVTIYKEDENNELNYFYHDTTSNQDEDLAFLLAVEQLIENEKI